MQKPSLFWRFTFGFGAALLVFIFDRLTKYDVTQIFNAGPDKNIALTPFLNLTEVHNYGITFGIFSHGKSGSLSPHFLALAAVIVAFFLLIWLLKTRSRLAVIALGMIIGGALGNAVDRWIWGFVTDFIRFHAFGYSWYVFNVADAGIVCGVLLLFLDAFLAEFLKKLKPDPNNEQNEQPDKKF